MAGEQDARARAITEQAKALSLELGKQVGLVRGDSSHTFNCYALVLAALSATADTARAQGRQEGLEEAACYAATTAARCELPANGMALLTFAVFLRARATPGDTP